MNKKDLLGKEINSALEDQVKNIELPLGFTNKILKTIRKPWKIKIHDLLNKEIVIPVGPAIVSLTILLIISIIPRDLLQNEKIKVVNIGSSQVIIRYEKEVSRK